MRVRDNLSKGHAGKSIAPGKVDRSAIRCNPGLAPARPRRLAVITRIAAIHTCAARSRDENDRCVGRPGDTRCYRAQMKRSLTAVVVSGALFTACGGNARSDERQPPAPSPSPSVPPEPTSGDNPRAPVATPGEGKLGVGCAIDADCVSPSLDTYLTAQARPLPAPRAFVGSKCVGASVLPAPPGPIVEGPACHCID